MGLAALLFAFSWHAETGRLRAQQVTALRDRAEEIRYHFHHVEDVLAAFAAMMSVRPDIGQAGFRRFATHVDWHGSGVENIGWVPRVTAADRAAFEARYSGDAPFHILQFVGPGRTAPAGEAETYFPLTLVVSETAQQKIPYGLDLLSEPMRRSAVQKALASRKLTISSLVALNNDALAAHGMRAVVLYPVEHDLTSSAQAADTSIDGFVAAVINVPQLVESVIRSQPRAGQHVYLVDQTDDGQAPALLHYHPSRVSTRPTAPLSVSALLQREPLVEPVPIAGRNWMLHAVPVHDFPLLAASRVMAPPLAVLALFGLIAAGVHLRARWRSSKQAHASEVERMLRIDVLTGLPNRRHLLDHLRDLQRPSRALLVLNIRRFRRIVESAGNAGADEVLRTLAQRLRAFEMPDCFVARLEGDEFALVLQGDRAARTQLGALAAQLRTAVQKTVDLNGQQLHLQCAIAAVDDSGGEPWAAEPVMTHAAAALRVAKGHSATSGELHFHDRARLTDGGRKLSMEADLRRAIENGSLQVHYQPQVLAHDLSVHGFESLVRWKRGEEWISPAEFLPLAEEAGLLAALDDLVLEHSLRQAAAWRRARPDFQGRVAVNTSAERFGRADFVAHLMRRLARLGVAPQWLELELTEGVLVEDIARTRRTLNELAEAGIHTALDDFGTGYSSLSYLRNLPVQWLKIDRSFVQGVQTERSDAAIVRATLAMARELRIGVVAEGVETWPVFEHLKAAGCQAVQGFLFSRAVPGADSLSLMDGFQASRSISSAIRR